MENFIKILIFTHIFAGCSALITGALAMMYKSQTPKHRIAGKFYFWSMSYIFVSGLYMAVHRNSLFFIFISFFVYHTLISAYRALKLKDLHKGQQPEMLDWAIEIIAGLANVCFVLFAAYWYTKGRGSDALIPLVFGFIGSRSVYKNIIRFRNRPNDPTHWLQTHISGMIGSYIGAITAFMVNQSSHIPIPQVILWLAPTAILTPFIIFEIRKVKMKVRPSAA
jgi:uncharacterized membrane protein